ncbi:hypothetical protein HIM_11367 [Hirsutella minnesotensis 3608]|uniref:Uncharacterized protein n=1 Tax=Hirsutella minnesotensis 3608 TaxID=1043627 RepID=A0A0F8A1A5_9HYPO|nr:hypothetical protein HIM_11367 [Hirsutella minnesotensis 3608]
MPRELPVTVSPEEVRRTLRDLESQRSHRRRSCQRPSPLIRVPHDEILRVLHDMDRRRAEDRSRRREAQYQYTAHTQMPTNPLPRRLGEEQAPSTPPPAQPKRPPKRHTQPPATPSPKRPREEHPPPPPVPRKTLGAASLSVTETTWSGANASHSTAHAA